MSTDIVLFQNPEFDGMIIERKEYAGEVTLEIHAGQVAPFLKAMKTLLGYNYLSDITAIDYYTEQKRFGLAYNLVNLEGKNVSGYFAASKKKGRKSPQFRISGTQQTGTKESAGI